MPYRLRLASYGKIMFKSLQRHGRMTGHDPVTCNWYLISSLICVCACVVCICFLSLPHSSFLCRSHVFAEWKRDFRSIQFESNLLHPTRPTQLQSVLSVILLRRNSLRHIHHCRKVSTHIPTIYECVPSYRCVGSSGLVVGSNRILFSWLRPDEDQIGLQYHQHTNKYKTIDSYSTKRILSSYAMRIIVWKSNRVEWVGRLCIWLNPSCWYLFQLFLLPAPPSAVNFR